MTAEASVGRGVETKSVQKIKRSWLAGGEDGPLEDRKLSPSRPRPFSSPTQPSMPALTRTSLPDTPWVAQA